jgi:hypothetical protein
MILIDANALIVLLVGLVNPRLIGGHKRTSIYEEQDFKNILQIIGQDVSKLVTIPNVWTEVDNLLKDFPGDLKNLYIEKISDTIKTSSEKYFASSTGVGNYYFGMLGLTDTLLLEYAKECELLITSDSKLSDYANAYGIKVFDLVKFRNEREFVQ